MDDEVCQEIAKMEEEARKIETADLVTKSP